MALDGVQLVRFLNHAIIVIGLCRYIQLPINAGMREAWEQPWQNIRPRGLPAGGAGTVQLPAVEAAVQLGVGVFASGSLGEGELLKDKLLLVSCGTILIVKQYVDVI